MDVIKTTNLSKSYGGRLIVNNVTMSVQKGEIYGLIGRNGAGKTTLIRMIMGLAAPDSGLIAINDRTTNVMLGAERSKIGSLIDSPSYSPYMSALDNMRAIAYTMGVNDVEKLKDILRFVMLNPDDRLPAKNFSLGMKQRLAIALALINDPEMLVLDEPVNGLDPTGMYEMRELLKKLNKERGVTIFISSHLLGELGKMASAYGIMEKGKLVREIRGKEIEELSRPFIKIVVGDIRMTVNVLADNFKPHEFEILPFNTIAIYSSDKDLAEISSVFINNGIPIISISRSEGDLEAAFIGIMGGVRND